jgi:hypothetical protein
MLSSPGRWLLALPRTALIDEQAAALTTKVLKNRISPSITAIHSDQPDKRGKVGRRIEDALRDRSSSEHSVVIITHEGLLGVDPTLLDGWGIAVDEVPEGGVLSDVFKAGNGWRTLADLYRLIPLSENSRWHLVMPRDDVELPTIGEVIHDTAKALVPFHKAALSKTRGVYVDMADWKDAKGTKKKVRWYSCWTPQGLAQHASSVTFTGAGVLNSLMYHAAQQAPSGPIPFEVKDISVETPRTARPKVMIYYYTRHLGATTWWETDEGSRCLVAVSRHLEAIGFDGYWSGNDVIRPYLRHRFPGPECLPKVAGTNSLRHHTRCAYIYSSKAQLCDDAVLETLGLAREDIRRAREDEDIVQFVFRGALRNGDFSGTYEIHLYSEDQADRLKDYLVSNRITDDVRLVGVAEAGIVEVKRPEPNTRSKPVEVDPVTARQREERRKVKAQERMQKYRDQRKAEEIANGTARRPGRPPRGAPSVEVIATDYLEIRCQGTLPPEGSDSTDLYHHELKEAQPSDRPQDQGRRVPPSQPSST